WHEKTLGQLFCDDSAKQIIRMLTDDLQTAGVRLSLGVSVERVARTGDGFGAVLSDGSTVRAASLVLATGGKSIPKMGATGWAYDTARAFGLRVTETRPALVPLTFEAGLLERLKPLAGVSVEAVVSHGRTRFAEGLLFTHRGLSGPSVLQISSYWREGESISVAMASGIDVFGELKAMKAANGRQAAHTALSRIVPKRLAEVLVEQAGLTGNRADIADRDLR